MRVVHATAPTRICDLGGWTDTWFAEHGSVLNLAVTPAVEVRVAARPAGDGPPLTLEVENEGRAVAGPHPLLEAAVEHVGVPERTGLHVAVRSDAPLGASMGTSAAVLVALVGALRALAGRPRPPEEVAAEAHRIEVEGLGLQSGVQDQLCAAFGGVCAIEVGPYPAARVTPVPVAPAVRRALESQLLVGFLGPHRSSVVHERVIAELAAQGPDEPHLDRLRRIARSGVEALRAGDLCAFGEAMWANTAEQLDLAPGMSSPAADTVLDLARRAGVLGGKMNGAGGEGGSITLLCGSERERLAADLSSLGPPVRLIPVALSPTGLRVS